MDFWDGFAHDPRRTDYGHIRASDADRELVRDALAQAYADGRLTREEHDERLTAALSAKTLGELPPVVSDLMVPTAVPTRRPRAEPHQQHLRVYRRRRWIAVPGSATPFVICTAIWLFTTPGGYFWPMWVLFPVLISVLSMVNADNRRRRRRRDRVRDRRE